MKRLKQLFKDSFRELKDTRKMAMAAMFVAIAVILGFYRLQLTVFVNLLLNTYWMSILYGNAYMVLFPTRAVKQLIMFPIEVILFYSVAKMFERANVFAIVRTKNN